MTTFNTGNPIPSTAVRDLYDNAENFDTAINTRSNERWIDRLGVSRLSYYGFEKAASVILASAGYGVPVPYTAGLNMTSQTQTVTYDGNVYAPVFSELPFTTSGTFEAAKFRLIQGITAFDLASPIGAAMIGFRQAGAGAVVETLETAGRRVVFADQYGATGDGITDDLAAVQAALNSGAKIIELRAGATYRWGSGNGPTIPTGVSIRGNGAIIVQPQYDASATGRVGTEYCGFRIALGSQNIHIDGVQFRGPFYGGTTQAVYRSIGLSVSGRYDQYFYNNPNYPANPPTPVSGTNSNIKVTNCVFDGWGQSGIIADQITRFVLSHCQIVNCGRDGVRMYGTVYGDVSDNFIRNMAPGFPLEGEAPNFNVYGITFTRVYRSATDDGSLADYRPSSNGICSRNIVLDCPTWKALDTHGGTDIIFDTNIVRNAHIGIGIDKGGFSTNQGYAPPRRIKCRGNIIVADPANPAGNRCGIFAVAHDATELNFGEDLELSGNHVEGFGQQVRDGNVVVSNYRRVVIDGFTIRGGIRAGINFQNTVEEYSIGEGVIQDIGITTAGTCVGINLQAANLRGVIDGVVFRKTDNADTMIAISSAGPAAGYGAKVGENLSFVGNITKFNSTGAFLLHDSPFLLKTLAWGNVNNGGTAALASAKGVASVTRTAVGIVRVVFTLPATITGTYIPLVTIKGSAARFGTASTVDDRTVDVYTRDQNGAAMDTAFFIGIFGF